MAKLHAIETDRDRDTCTAMYTKLYTDENEFQSDT